MKRCLLEAWGQGADMVCFPEPYLPSLRRQDFEASPFDQTERGQSLPTVAERARRCAVAAILGMENQRSSGQTGLRS